ncbi:MAG: sugar phosphate nucleotidyltransferase [Oligoflexia bacterium]|nr:sugar phosphate nucleotidyltransferase [Oligoflexia bacterium]
MPVTQAMLMAAGLGTRLKPFTDRAPKALLPVLGIPAAQYATDNLALAGVRKIVANIHHHPEKMRAGLATIDTSAELIVSDESRLLLGSAGGIKRALPYFDRKPFFLINADVLCDIDLAALARTHERLRQTHGVMLTLAIAPQGPAGGKYAEILHDDDLVRGIGAHAKGKPFFVGAAVFEPEALDYVPDGIPAETVPTIFSPAIAMNKAGFHPISGGYGIWKDIGSPALWLDAHLEIIARLETGALPGIWRRRIESVAQRAANGIWAGRGVRFHQGEAPCYWDGNGVRPPKLGPNAVLYGDAASAQLSGGIGFEGLWVHCPQLG